MGGLVAVPIVAALGVYTLFFQGGFWLWAGIIAAAKIRDGTTMDGEQLKNKFPVSGVLPDAALKVVPDLHESRPWRTCRSSTGNLYALGNHIAARDSNVIAAAAEYRNPSWIIVQHESKLLRGEKVLDHDQPQYGIYKVPFIEAWADNQQLSKRSLLHQARTLNAMRIQGDELHSELYPVIQSLSSTEGTETVVTSNSRLGRFNTSATELGDAMAHYREKLNVKPGVFKVVDADEGGIELQCPEEMHMP